MTFDSVGMALRAATLLQSEICAFKISVRQFFVY
jgi:hypothetical protein